LDKYKEGLNINPKKFVKRVLSLKNHNGEKYFSLIQSRTKFLMKNSTFGSRLYCVINKIKTVPKCPVCNKPNNFIDWKRGYANHCSKGCTRKDPKVKEKDKQTCLKKYGVEYTGQAERTKNKREDTLLKRYGVENPSQMVDFAEKSKKTFLKNYGVDHPSKSKEIREKTEKTNLKRYGVDHPSKSKEIREKTEKTSLAKYGNKCSLQNKDVRKKCQNIRRIKFVSKLLNSNRLGELVKPNFDLNEFKTVFNNYSWKCVKCETEFEDNLDNGKTPRCPTCYPMLKGTSKAEQEVLEFVKQYYPNVENPNRTILDGKHIDIYIPELKLGIEYNGLYWHSELGGKTNPKYHQNKTLLAKEKGVHLIQIFEDEWIEKQNIVKSILLNKMGKSPNKIFARKCKIKEVDNKIAKQFLFDNHLQGEINGTHLGLYFESELVSMISMGKSRFNKSFDYEILRFCNKLNTSVTGGLSKVLSYFKKLNHDSSIITYADARYGEGKGYEKCGFEYKKLTSPGYYYLKNNIRESRMKYQKYKLKDLLEVFDPNLTEWQNMQLNGFDRIWDCGNYKYEL